MVKIGARISLGKLMKQVLLLAFLFVAPTQALAAFYGAKPGTVFYTGPNGEAVEVGPALIQTLPLERRNEWCFFKLADGRGAPVNPPAAWAKCNSLGKFVGN